MTWCYYQRKPADFDGNTVDICCKSLLLEFKVSRWNLMDSCHAPHLINEMQLLGTVSSKVWQWREAVICYHDYKECCMYADKTEVHIETGAAVEDQKTAFDIFLFSFVFFYWPGEMKCVWLCHEIRSFLIQETLWSHILLRPGCTFNSLRLARLTGFSNKTNMLKASNWMFQNFWQNQDEQCTRGKNLHVDQVKNGQQNYNLTGDLFFQVLVVYRILLQHFVF